MNLGWLAVPGALHVVGEQMVSDTVIVENRVNSVFAERALRHSAPTVWNSLPQYLISDRSNFSTFKRHLKTELYRRAFLR